MRDKKQKKSQQNVVRTISAVVAWYYITKTGQSQYVFFDDIVISSP